jgi:hypothetical protein
MLGWMGGYIGADVLLRGGIANLDMRTNHDRHAANDNCSAYDYDNDSGTGMHRHRDLHLGVRRWMLLGALLADLWRHLWRHLLVRVPIDAANGLGASHRSAV